MTQGAVPPSASPPPSADAVQRALAWARGQWPWLALGGAVVLGVVALLFRSTEPLPTRAADDAAPPVPAAAPAAPGAAPAAPSAAASAAASRDAGAAPAVAEAPDAGGPPSPNVRVEFKVYPGRRASVVWGDRRLGFIDRGKPLVVERPRDSGPMDVVIRAPGFVPVHTRAYTFDDTVIDVRITPLDKKDTLYGYQQPLPPEGDAGAPL